MEDDLNYATVVFRKKQKNITLAKEHDKEEAIYVEVNVTNQNPTTTEEEKPPSHPYRLRLVAVGVGIICLFLGSIIIALCYITSVNELNAKLAGDLKQLRDNHTSQLNANRNLITLIKSLSSASEILQNDYNNTKRLQDNLTSVHHILWRAYINITVHTQICERERINFKRLTENLTREKDDLNWTLGFIFHFDSFPVQAYCPKGDENRPTQGRTCQPCPGGWVLFQSSCYWFAAYMYQRINWVQSREDCKMKNSHLAVIGSQEEQEFINRQSPPHTYESQVYWIGLYFTYSTDQWVWVDGSKLGVRYWRTRYSGSKYKCVSTTTKTHTLDNWDEEYCSTKYKWICETKAMKKSD